MAALPALTLVARMRRALWVVGVLVRSRMIAPLRPDRLLRLALVVRRYGANPLTGISLAAARAPRRTALVDERGSMTWAELERRSDALAAALLELGDESPETIGILCRNHRGFVEALTAAAKAGVDALLLNTGFSGPQLTDVLEREGATVLVYDEEFAELVSQARTTVDGLVEVLAWTDSPTDAHTVEGLVARHVGRRAPKPARAGRIILLTSGTTGPPKGARRSGSGGAAALAAMLDRIPWRAEETVVVAAPMFHAWGFGQLAIAATMTCTVVIGRRFDPEATLQLAQEHDATGLAVVPVMLERIIDLPAATLDRYRLPHLRFVTASGSKMRPDAVTAFMDRFGEVVYNSYNATEAGLITTATPTDLRQAPETAGRAVAGTEVRILTEGLTPAAPGEVGKICVLSDSTFEGYTSGDTKDFHEDFMVSGDVGRIDGSGLLFVVGRDDEMIVSGGENVYPLEVEQTLNDHDSVLEAAVTGVDDATYGQRLAAFVVRRPGSDVDAEELRRHVKQQLAGYKVPRDVVFVEELPRNASGKVVKRDLPHSSSSAEAS